MTLAPRSAHLPDSPHKDSLDPAPTPSSQDQRLLKALATAMVNHPRATMGELAELAGVSRATLNRHCGTREGLKRRLESHARSTLERLTHSAALQRLEPREALRELIREHLAQRDLLALLMFEQNPGRQAGHGDASGSPMSKPWTPSSCAASRSVCSVSISARRPSANSSSS